MNLVTPRFTLLQKKVSFDDQPTDLFYTLCIGNSNVMALLMTAPGANLAIENDDGKTVEQLARYSSNWSNVTTLETDLGNFLKNINAPRDGNHKSVLALIPGTMEQIQAEVLALKESMRNMQMGQGGARINVPECPVSEASKKTFFLLSPKLVWVGGGQKS